MSAPPPGNPPPAEVIVDAALVTRLLEDQHPDLTALPLRLAAEGWDNLTFRIGEQLAVRLPRRRVAAQLIENEQAWLPRLAPHLPIAIPAPVRSGRPGAGFPWHWSVVPWIDGEQALTAPLDPGESRRLGEFLEALHQIPVPAAAPANPYRGVSLTERSGPTMDRLDQLAADPGYAGLAAAAGAVFGAAAAAPLDTPAAWLHGDLHGKNIISDGGQIVAIVDWGDICSGDIATDLAAVWMMFPDPAHELFWEGYGDVSAATRLRARGWAIAFGLMLWGAHHDADPIFAEAGLVTIKRACEM